MCNQNTFFSSYFGTFVIEMHKWFFTLATWSHWDLLFCATFEICMHPDYAIKNHLHF